MRSLAYWKAVTADQAGFLDQVLALLQHSGIPYGVVGGQGVNAYVEPVRQPRPRHRGGGR